MFFSFFQFLFFTWQEMLHAFFTGMTSASPTNFVFVLLILTAPFYIVWQRFRNPDSDVWTRFAAKGAYSIAIIGPLVPLVVLYLASWRASVVLGHWPLCMLDDPKFICDGDALYEQLCSYFPWACAFGGWSILTFGSLLLPLLGRISQRRLGRIIAVFVCAWILFIIEPGSRYAWWLD